MAKKHCANCKCYEKCPTCGSEVPEGQIARPAPWAIYPYTPYPWGWTWTSPNISITSGTGSAQTNTVHSALSSVSARAVS